jgi:hypothetical protein
VNSSSLEKNCERVTELVNRIKKNLLFNSPDAPIVIDLQESEIERVRRGNWGNFLVINGNVDIKK